MGSKYCKKCDSEKPIEAFWKNQCSCIVCHKHMQKTHWKSRTPLKRLEQHLKYKYGVSHDDFLKAWEDQAGNCAICEIELPDLMVYDNRRRGYAIDHNHETGEFRGILCLKCNTLLGMATDSINVLHSAINYLTAKGSYAAARKKGK